MRIVIEITGNESASIDRQTPESSPPAAAEAPPEAIRKTAEALGAFSAGPAPAALRSMPVPIDNLARPSPRADASGADATDAGAAPEHLRQLATAAEPEPTSTP